MTRFETSHPTARQLKKDWLITHLNSIKTNSSLEVTGRDGWPVYDSPLDFGSLETLRLHDLPRIKGLSPFSYFFINLIPPQYSSFKDYIQDKLAARSGQAIGLELGGPASRLFGGFDQGFFRQSVGVTLKDLRKLQDPSGTLVCRDEARGHQVLAADLLDDNTPAEIDKVLGGKKADFIIQRLLGAIGILSTNPFWIAQKLDLAYQFLNEGGVMFAQVPDISNDILLNWADYADQQGLPIELGNRPNSRTKMVMRIERHPNSPDHIPTLPAKDVLSWCKRQFPRNRLADPNLIIYAMEG